MIVISLSISSDFLMVQQMEFSLIMITIIWSGSGIVVVLVFGLTSIIINVCLSFYDWAHFVPNFYAPQLLTSVFLYWWNLLCERMITYRGKRTWLSDLFDEWGHKHSLYYIDLKMWTWIFLGLGLLGRLSM